MKSYNPTNYALGKKSLQKDDKNYPTYMKTYFPQYQHSIYRISLKMQNLEMA